jgi:ATP-dependent helicase/DNAse subunit B
MPHDKFTATWVSHSSISDFLKCPRAYYLNNVYKDPKTGHKISITSPAMSLGSAVHNVLESLSTIPTPVRFKESLISKFEETWKSYTGKKGGFTSKDQEQEYKKRGEEMVKSVMKNPGPLKRLSVKINQDLPHYWISPEDNIILCGKVDWLEYFPDSDTVGIVDFKTGKNREDDNSLQLPIYSLLVHNCQKRKATKANYWYLAEGNELLEKELPDLEQSHEKVLAIAKKIKLARKLENFKCPQGAKGCFVCKPLESVIAGEAEFVGESQYGQDLYLIDKTKMSQTEDDSVIL